MEISFPGKSPKLMVFAWCKDGRHDECRAQYGDPANPNLICTCNCSDHGVNVKSFAQKLSEQEIKTVVKEINDSKVSVEKKGGYNYSAWMDDDYKYVYKPAYDAETIEELEQRRRKPGQK